MLTLNLKFGNQNARRDRVQFASDYYVEEKPPKSLKDYKNNVRCLIESDSVIVFTRRMSTAMSDTNTLAGTLVLPKTSDLEMLASGVLEWYSAAQRFYPWFASDNPFELMVAEVLLQRTQTAQVASHFRRFIGKYSTSHILENAEIDEMQMDLHSFGLAKRAALLIRLGKKLNGRHAGVVPMDARELEALPSIGRYTAAAVRCFAFGIPDGVVDANVVRVFSRYFGLNSKKKRPREDANFWRLANALCATVPTSAASLNRGLIQLASDVCVNRTPACDECPIQRGCNFAASLKASKVGCNTEQRPLGPEPL